MPAFQGEDRGAVLSGYAVGALVDAAGWRTAFFAVAVVCLLATSVCS